MHFQCPSCKEIVSAADGQYGKKMNCQKCSCPVLTPDSAFGAGIVIGDFIIIKKLGAGGAGVVYLAHQISLDRPAALKIIREAASDASDDPVNDLIREARSAAKLNHPNIVQAYAVGEDDGIFYFAMEYVEGETMKSVLKREQTIDPKRAAEIIKQIADALQCAWEKQKLTHRDIKPDNIMLTDSNQAKLADLGLSRRAGEHHEEDDSDEVMGTPQYISPEQLTGAPVDTRSDIYSLGATFFQFVTGRFPYEGPDVDEIAKQHVIGNLTPPREINHNIPEEINYIIVKMMARYPDKRYQTPGELSAALEAYLHPTAASGGIRSAALGAAQQQAEASGGGLRAGGMKVLEAPKSSGSSLKGAFHRPDHTGEKEVPHTIGIGVPTSLDSILPPTVKPKVGKVDAPPPGSKGAAKLDVHEKKSNSAVIMLVILVVLGVVIGAAMVTMKKSSRNDADTRPQGDDGSGASEVVVVTPTVSVDPAEVFTLPAPVVEVSIQEELQNRYMNFILACRTAALNDDVEIFRSISTAFENESAAMAERSPAEQRQLKAMLDNSRRALLLYADGLKVKRAFGEGEGLVGILVDYQSRPYKLTAVTEGVLTFTPEGHAGQEFQIEAAQFAMVNNNMRNMFFNQVGQKIGVQEALYAYLFYMGGYPALQGMQSTKITRFQQQDFERSYFRAVLKYGTEDEKTQLGTTYGSYDNLTWARRNLDK